MDLTGAISYFGSPSAKAGIAADLAEQRLDLTVRKEILWESETASDAEVRAMEIKLIRETRREQSRNRLQPLPALVGVVLRGGVSVLVSS